VNPEIVRGSVLRMIAGRGRREVLGT